MLTLMLVFVPAAFTALSRLSLLSWAPLNSALKLFELPAVDIAERSVFILMACAAIVDTLVNDPAKFMTS
ncbi:hypothetical protein HV90_21965 [Pseudomonas aeruginosa]|nr:hypothetical protein DZ899_25210 [Pseudomonas aeruginosa]PPA91880.1 hypothetical protein HV90_21965 [Pseudomonas aeruginosa]TQR65375.1 hypothetical protein DMY46_18015 [Pseudomonas aeruginosa]HBP5523669.1 hypothetical protein [Pseudomonas aeruginosa]